MQEETKEAEGDKGGDEKEEQTEEEGDDEEEEEEEKKKRYVLHIHAVINTTGD